MTFGDKPTRRPRKNTNYLKLVTKVKCRYCHKEVSNNHLARLAHDKTCKGRS